MRVLGGFTVTKHVTGETAGYVGRLDLHGLVLLLGRHDRNADLEGRRHPGVNSLPIGTTCDLSETGKPATKDASYAWGPESWTPSNSVTISVNDSDNTVGVVLTNPLVRVLGGFTVTKHVTGETGGYVADSTFTVSYSCSDGTTGTLTLTDGDTAGVTGLPHRTTCDALGDGASRRPRTPATPGVASRGTRRTRSTIVVNSDNTVGVVLTNPLVRVLGGFDVTKQVTGAVGRLRGRLDLHGDLHLLGRHDRQPAPHQR